MSSNQFAYSDSPLLQSDYSDFTVIIPTLNEKHSIKILLKQLFELYPGIKVIVVDDNSDDGTQEAVLKYREDNKINKDNLLLLQRANAAHRGITASVIDACFQCKTDYFIVMDADLQHPADVIFDVCQNLKSGADIVVPCREEFYQACPWWRKVFTFLASNLVSFFLIARGIRVSDPLSGFFATKSVYFKKAVQFNSNGFQPRGYKVLFDFLKVLSSNKFKEFCQQEKINKLDIRQVFYKFESRKFGQSKLRPIHAYWLFKSVLS